MKEFKLDNEFKITSGYITPDDYFDQFPERISSKLCLAEPKVVSFYSLKKQWYFAAAAILILLLSIPIYNQYAGSGEIDTATLENYIAYQSNISEDEIVNLLEQEDIDKIQLELNVDDSAIEDALQYNSNLEQYLID